MDLLKETRNLVETSGLPRKEICLGAGVGSRWLDYLVSDLQRDPRIGAVQRVYDFLSKPASNETLPVIDKTSLTNSE